MPPETVAPAAALHVRTANVEDAHIRPAGGDKGVQLPQKQIIGGGAAGVFFQHVPLEADQVETGAANQQGHKEEQDE